MTDEQQPIHKSVGNTLLRVLGIAAVVAGVLASSFGRVWSPQVYTFYERFELMNKIDSFMPYFPLVPLYPLLLITLGAYLIARSRQ